MEDQRMTDEMKAPRLHFFTSTGTAYDYSQTNEGIEDGDILVCPSEGAIAIMCGAWPVAITQAHRGRHFHVFKTEDDAAYAENWESDPEYRKYAPAVALAGRINLDLYGVGEC